jgi:hypothetical protein
MLWPVTLSCQLRINSFILEPCIVIAELVSRPTPSLIVTMPVTPFLDHSRPPQGIWACKPQCSSNAFNVQCLPEDIGQSFFYMSTSNAVYATSLCNQYEERKRKKRKTETPMQSLQTPRPSSKVIIIIGPNCYACRSVLPGKVVQIGVRNPATT